ncbi:hypothetical protein [Ectobacillus ponti]|uniref:Uncharacterized protein n=1 Tax=Ectobacillus ponti TaxID=2961894 RepID=A0AA42BS29_9BACI|nr:hypothetical protein [Ectobacillus ponti]MCP8970946.1 hypothetical protein [Ectobacillus ponti]
MNRSIMIEVDEATKAILEQLEQQITKGIHTTLQTFQAEHHKALQELHVKLQVQLQGIEQQTRRENEKLGRKLDDAIRDIEDQLEQLREETESLKQHSVEVTDRLKRDFENMMLHNSSKTAKQLQEELGATREDLTGAMEGLKQELGIVVQNSNEAAKQLTGELQVVHQGLVNTMGDLKTGLCTVDENSQRALEQLKQELNVAQQDSAAIIRDLQEEVSGVMQNFSRTAEQLARLQTSLPEQLKDMQTSIEKSGAMQEKALVGSVRKLEEQREAAYEELQSRLERIRADQQAQLAELASRNSLIELEQLLSAKQAESVRVLADQQREMRSALESAFQAEVKALGTELDITEDIQHLLQRIEQLNEGLQQLSQPFYRRWFERKE